MLNKGFPWFPSLKDIPAAIQYISDLEHVIDSWVLT